MALLAISSGPPAGTGTGPSPTSAEAPQAVHAAASRSAVVVKVENDRRILCRELHHTIAIHAYGWHSPSCGFAYEAGGCSSGLGRHLPGVMQQ